MIIHAIGALTNEHDADFLQGMVSRMDMAFHKYGRFRENTKGQYTQEFLRTFRILLLEMEQLELSVTTTANVNPLLFAMKRILCYVYGYKGAPGNTEYLMDAANALMMEFASPQVPGAHFKPTDDDKSPGTVGLSEKESADFREKANEQLG